MLTAAAQHKRLLVLAGVSCGGGLLLYRAYHSDRVAKALRIYAAISNAVQQYGGALLAGGEISNALLQDIRAFLQSDQEELPRSLQQFARLLQAPEVQGAAAALTSSLVQGVATACQSSTLQHALPQLRSLGSGTIGDSASGGSRSMLDGLLEALLSARGQSLVSLAVGVGVRSATQGYCQHLERAAVRATAAGRQEPSLVQQLLAFASTPSGEAFCMRAVDAFVRGGSEIYMERIEGLNQWSDLLAAVHSPEHRGAATHLTRVFVNELVRTWLRPSERRPEAEETTGSGLPPRTPTSSQPCTPFAASLQLQQAQLPPLQRSQEDLTLMSEGKARQHGRAVRSQPRPKLPQRQQQVATTIPLHAVAREAVGSPRKPARVYTGIAGLAIRLLSKPEGRLVVFTLSSVAISEGLQTGYQIIMEGQAAKALGMSLRHVYGAAFMLVIMAVYVIQSRSSLKAAAAETI